MAKKDTDDHSVIRISASDKNTKAKTPKQDNGTGVKKRRNPIAAFFGYFIGAWRELRQVHWPTRRATWGLTGAVLIFSGFFVVFILLLDAVFKFGFELILK